MTFEWEFKRIGVLLNVDRWFHYPQDGSPVNRFIQFAKEAPEVIEIYQLGGQYNFLIKVVTESMQTLNDFNEQCSKVAFTTTMTVLSKPFEEKAILLKGDDF